MEPAIFLAGITGLRCQSEDGRNHWEMYLSHDTACVRERSMLLHSLYEAQNPTILSHYFNADSGRRDIHIGTEDVYQTSQTPYDCYALSYCLAHSSDRFRLSIDVSREANLTYMLLLVTIGFLTYHHMKLPVFDGVQEALEKHNIFELQGLKLTTTTTRRIAQMNFV